MDFRFNLLLTLLIIIIISVLFSIFLKKYKRAKLYKGLVKQFKQYEKECFELMKSNNLEKFKEMFFKFKVNPNICDQTGVTLLMYSIQKRYNFTKFLIENGANVNLPDKAGQTPLLLACHYNKFQTVQYLLEQKSIDINAASLKHRFYINPLLSCLYKNYYNLATLLLKKNASITKIKELLAIPDTLISLDQSANNFLSEWERFLFQIIKQLKYIGLLNGKLQLIYTRYQQKKSILQNENDNYKNYIGRLPEKFFNIILEEYL